MVLHSDFSWRGFCAPGGLLTNLSIQLPIRAPATLNLPTALRECQCLILNFYLDSSVSRQKSLQRLKFGTRPWGCLLKAFHSFWKNASPFLTQSVFLALPSALWSRLALRLFPSWGGHCVISYSKKVPGLLSLPKIIKGQIHCDKEVSIVALTAKETKMAYYLSQRRTDFFVVMWCLKLSPVGLWLKEYPLHYQNICWLLFTTFYPLY